MGQAVSLLLLAIYHALNCLSDDGTNEPESDVSTSAVVAADHGSVPSLLTHFNRRQLLLQTLYYKHYKIKHYIKYNKHRNIIRHHHACTDHHPSHGILLTLYYMYNVIVHVYNQLS